MKSLLVGVITLIAATTATINMDNKCDKVGEQFPSLDRHNTCTCTEDHIITCNHTQECIARSTVPLGDGCNECYCSNDAEIGLCTLIGCDGFTPAAVSREDNLIIVPLPSRQLLAMGACKAGDIIPAGDGCNNCTCVEYGRVGHCTLFDCCEHEGKRVPSPDACNTCYCRDDGMRGLCGQKGCPLWQTPPVSEN